MLIDEALVRRLEDLAQLSLKSEERGALIGDLNEILQMMKKLDELELPDIEPLTHITETYNKLRPDQPRDQLDTAKALENAADKTDEFFKVPKMMKR